MLLARKFARIFSALAGRFVLLAALPVAMLVALFAALPAPSSAAVQQADQRLVLVDGTDQIVREFEAVDDRVRYFSSERLKWEEIPESLVDWEATHAAELEAQQIAEVEIEQALEILRPIAPGVGLPEVQGVYVYDGMNLQRLQQSQGEVKNDAVRRVLGMIIPLSVVKGRARIELTGTESKIVVRKSTPVFYVQFDPVSELGYGLVRVEIQDDLRVVGQIEISSVRGKMKEYRDMIPVQWELAFAASAEESPAVWRLSPEVPLEPGEYAVVEFVDEERQNLFVWDFHVTIATISTESIGEISLGTE
jgi:hypothetical protein